MVCLQVDTVTIAAGANGRPNCTTVKQEKGADTAAVELLSMW